MIESQKTLAWIAGIPVLMLALYLVLLFIPQPKTYDARQDQISLLSINPVNVRSMTTVLDGRQHVFEQKDGVWRCDGAETDYNTTDLRVTCVSYLYSDNLVCKDAEDLAVYGLDEPAGEASFVTDTEERYRVLFGIETVDRASRYMMIDGDNDVYTLPIEAFDIIFQNE